MSKSFFLAFFLVFCISFAVVQCTDEEINTKNIFDTFFPKPDSIISKEQYEDFLLQFLVDPDYKNIKEENNKEEFELCKLTKISVKAFLDQDTKESFTIEDIQTDLQSNKLINFLTSNMHSIFMSTLQRPEEQGIDINNFIKEEDEIQKLLQEDEEVLIRDDL